jgi:murein DD-endopeptidase MepM/ murein hydrolase activator NlpD
MTTRSTMTRTTFVLARLWLVLALLLPAGAVFAAPVEDATVRGASLPLPLPSSERDGAQAAQSNERPFVLPFAAPPGPDTWLMGQAYGNTVGAYFNRNTTYRYSQGIHFGVDLSAACGTEIVALADGVVGLVDAMAYGSAPHNLIIDHPQLGYATLYGHLLQRPNLSPGQEVKQGQVVALSGDPEETCFGRPHLHLEIRDYPGRGWKFNPVNLIDADWDNLALVGGFRSGFERDLDDPRKWQHLDDQPRAVTGGPIINDFANPWPRTR